MTLGLTMIVKNESDVLARVLAGIRAAVNEIVIVDTGSTDDTVSIARRFTDKVYSYQWTDDFSAARNYALSRITTDYWMWLDADDIVPKRTAKAIAEFMKTADGSVDAVMLPYELGGVGGKPSFTFYRERIMKNSPKFRWNGRVHEAVCTSGNIIRLNAPIIHAKPSTRTSGTRNLDIYEKMRESGEEFDSRAVYYYARELYHNGFYARAAAEFSQFLSRKDGFWVNKCDACIMSARCYVRLGDPDSAMTAAIQSLAYGLPTGEACCEIASLFFARADYACAAYWYARAAAIKPDSVSGAFVDMEYYGFIPYVWLAVCYDRLGNTAKAYKYHCKARKLHPDHASVVSNQAYFESLGYK